MNHPGLQAVYKTLMRLHNDESLPEEARDSIADILDMFAGWCSDEYDIGLVDRAWHASRLTIRSANEIADRLKAP